MRRLLVGPLCAPPPPVVAGGLEASSPLPARSSLSTPQTRTARPHPLTILALALLACSPSSPVPPSPQPPAQPSGLPTFEARPLPIPGAPPPAGALPPLAIPNGPPGQPGPPGLPHGPPGETPPLSPDWSKPILLASQAQRPQLMIDDQGGKHLIFYAARGSIDQVRYRYAPPGKPWGLEEQVGQPEGRQWGPDLVIGPGSIPWACWDNARADGNGHIFLSRRGDRGWEPPIQLSEAPDAEVSSAHLGFDHTGTLSVIWLSRVRGPGQRMVILERRRTPAGQLEPIQVLFQGSLDAWHANLVSASDGRQIIGFDLTSSPVYRQVQALFRQAGRAATPVPLGGQDLGSERPNFSLESRGPVHAVWTLSHGIARVGVVHRRGLPEKGALRWEPEMRPGEKLRGLQYDPDVTSSSARTLMAWAWRDAASAILVSRLSEQGYSPPARVAELEGEPRFPSLAADPTDGSFHLVWNQGPDDAHMQLYYARETVRK